MRSRDILTIVSSIVTCVAALHFTGCRVPLRESRIYDVNQMPGETAGKEGRLVGWRFLDTGFRADGMPQEGAVGNLGGQPAGGRPIAGAGPSRIALRLYGPKGWIDREFVVAPDYDGPASISTEDARTLGIEPAGVDVLIRGENGAKRETRREANVRAESLSSRAAADLLVTWPAEWPKA